MQTAVLNKIMTSWKIGCSLYISYCKKVIMGMTCLGYIHYRIQFDQIKVRCPNQHKNSSREGLQHETGKQGDADLISSQHAR